MRCNSQLSGAGILVLLVVLLSAVQPACAQTRGWGRHAAGLPRGFVRHLNIPYAHIPGVAPKLLSLDIYAPRDAEDLPVMVFAHGGSWTMGDKGSVARLPQPQFFCEQGFVYVAINYRLVPAVRHPDNVRDVTAAVAWVHDHIREYGGDPARLFLMGHSAGGHLVSLVATDDRRLAEYGKDPAILSGVISNDCQAYNIPAVIPQMPLAARLYPTVFGNDPGVLRDASPITHISPDKHVPPFLLIYSAASAYAPVRARHAALMASAVRAAGSRARLVGIPRRGHEQVNELLGLDGEVTTAEVLRFLRAELRRTPTDTRLSP